MVVIRDMHLALIINDQLKNSNFRNKGLNYNEFTEEELLKITTIKITGNGVKDISDLIYLKNLKELEISSLPAKMMKNVTNEINVRPLEDYKYYQVSVKNFQAVSELTNLEYLKIENVSTVEKLDLSKLTNLWDLELNNNQNLTDVLGLENSKKLASLKMYRNNFKQGIALKKLINNGLNNIKLDFDMYPQLIANDSSLYSFLIEQLKYGLDIKFIENLSGLWTNEIPIIKIDEMNKIAYKILNDIIKSDFSEIEKVTAIYYYIIKNVDYDNKGLAAKKNGTNNEQKKEHVSVSGETLKSKYNKINSSYNAITEKSAVCEGITNMMHYLLKLINIDSRTASCGIGANNLEYIGYNSNHSIIRVKINNEWYYFDPTNDKIENKIQYFLKTKDEISKTHILSMDESIISSSKIKAYSNEELSRVFNFISGNSSERLNNILQSEKSQEDKQNNLDLRKLHSMTIEERVNYAKSVISNYSVDSAEYGYYNSIINQNIQRKGDVKPIIEEAEDRFNKLSSNYKREKSYQELWIEYIKNDDHNFEEPKKSEKEILIDIVKKIRSKKELTKEEKDIYEKLNQINTNEKIDFNVEKYPEIDPNELEFYYREISKIEMAGDLNYKRVR